jgi:hypothetical protein
MAAESSADDRAAVVRTALDYFWQRSRPGRWSRPQHAATASAKTQATVASRSRSRTCTARSRTRPFGRPCTWSTSSSCTPATAGRSSTPCGPGRPRARTSSQLDQRTRVNEQHHEDHRDTGLTLHPRSYEPGRWRKVVPGLTEALDRAEAGSSAPWPPRCPAGRDTGEPHPDRGTRARQSDDDADANAAQTRP